MEVVELDTPAAPRPPTGLRSRGKRLWRELHESADFTGSPETVMTIEEACFLADEIERLRKIIRKAGSDTRVAGYNGQQVSMPEVGDMQRNQTLLLSMLKAIRVDDPEHDGKLSRSEVGRKAASARWDRA